ncbi:hypothetical protein BaRGS_00014510 [Batillaria attramentaria]|uniref:Uncharacterized protein n=1 Tax=Batillaria attramentaria TaxID=370345 RepID=A0ABD0L3X4_9CAEN
MKPDCSSLVVGSVVSDYYVMVVCVCAAGQSPLGGIFGLLPLITGNDNMMQMFMMYLMQMLMQQGGGGGAGAMFGALGR